MGQTSKNGKRIIQTAVTAVKHFPEKMASNKKARNHTAFSCK
jgi:hypothetical protein